MGDVLESTDFTKLLFPYLKSRITSLVHARGKTDEVEAVMQELEKDTSVIQCPACSTCISRSTRNCDNADCSVGNVRKAVAELIRKAEFQQSARKENSLQPHLVFLSMRRVPVSPIKEQVS